MINQERLRLRKALHLAVIDGNIEGCFDSAENPKRYQARLRRRSAERPRVIIAQAYPVTGVIQYGYEKIIPKFPGITRPMNENSLPSKDEATNYPFSISEQAVLIRPGMGHFSNYD